MVALYNILIILLSPLWLIWMVSRANRRKEKVVWRERFGKVKSQNVAGARCVWIHAVSVGEILAMTTILRGIKKLDPSLFVVVSVTTSSGHSTAEKEHAQDPLYDQLVYFPVDLPWVTHRVMKEFRPRVVALAETELWLNLLRSAKKVGATTVLINGRISDRSFARSLAFIYFFKVLFRYLDFARMQSEVDCERIEALGALSVENFGNCKFDQALSAVIPPQDDVLRKYGLTEHKLVIVIGSTRGEEEEEFVFKALRHLGLERLKLLQIIHAPRHIERSEAILKAAKELGLDAGLRTRKESHDYLVLDTYGELGEVYSVADLVIVGGGFAELGGQNILQPLALGKPVIHGPHMSNFRAIAEEAARRDATIVVTTPYELADAMKDLLAHPEARMEYSNIAREMIAESAGASKRYCEEIVQLAGIVSANE